MRSRWKTRAIFLSAALLGITIIFWIIAICFDPNNKPLSFGENFHVGVTGRGLDGRLSFFSDSEGPYRGSIIGIEGGPPFIEYGFGDRFGIYYRYFRWPDESVLWTLLLSLWYPAILFGVLPSLWIVGRLIRKKTTDASFSN